MKEISLNNVFDLKQTLECGAEEFVNFTGKGPCVTAPWDTKVDNIIFDSYALVQLCQLGHPGEARQAVVCL